jgi:hypothetical protein
MPSPGQHHAVEHLRRVCEMHAGQRATFDPVHKIVLSPQDARRIMRLLITQWNFNATSSLCRPLPYRRSERRCRCSNEMIQFASLCFSITRDVGHFCWHLDEVVMSERVYKRWTINSLLHVHPVGPVFEGVEDYSLAFHLVGSLLDRIYVIDLSLTVPCYVPPSS